MLSNHECDGVAAEVRQSLNVQTRSVQTRLERSDDQPVLHYAHISRIRMAEGNWIKAAATPHVWTITICVSPPSEASTASLMQIRLNDSTVQASLTLMGRLH